MKTLISALLIASVVASANAQIENTAANAIAKTTNNEFNVSIDKPSNVKIDEVAIESSLNALVQDQLNDIAVSYAWEQSYEAYALNMSVNDNTDTPVSVRQRISQELLDDLNRSRVKIEDLTMQVTL